MAERQRQVKKENYSVIHDDRYLGNELALAAAAYALPEGLRPTRRAPTPGGTGMHIVPYIWPIDWDPRWWKPGLRRRDLVKAAALLLAEIERMDRFDHKVAEQLNRQRRLNLKSRNK